MYNTVVSTGYALFNLTVYVDFILVDDYRNVLTVYYINIYNCFPLK